VAQPPLGRSGKSGDIVTALLYTDDHPRMPSTHELLILLVVIFAIWILLKVARLAIRVILFIITIAVVAGVLWLVLAR